MCAECFISSPISGHCIYIEKRIRKSATAGDLHYAFILCNILKYGKMLNIYFAKRTSSLRLLNDFTNAIKAFHCVIALCSFYISTEETVVGNDDNWGDKTKAYKDLLHFYQV